MRGLIRIHRVIRAYMKSKGVEWRTGGGVRLFTNKFALWLRAFEWADEHWTHPIDYSAPNNAATLSNPMAFGVCEICGAGEVEICFSNRLGRVCCLTCQLSVPRPRKQLARGHRKARPVVALGAGGPTCARRSRAWAGARQPQGAEPSTARGRGAAPFTLKTFLQAA